MFDDDDNYVAHIINLVAKVHIDMKHLTIFKQNIKPWSPTQVIHGRDMFHLQADCIQIVTWT